MKKGLIDPGHETPKQITNLIMNIVTVTCTRDKFAMQLQAHSIDLFVTEKVTHWVIIQDTTTSYLEWEELLKPYYSFHELKLIPSWINNNLNGWNQQQILKFEAAKYIQEDRYLILDSKNLFIKRTNLSEFMLEGHRHYIDTKLVKPNFQNWYKFLNSILGFEEPTISWVPQTPFTVKTGTIKKILSLDLEKIYIEFFDQYNDNPSEFLLYRYFSDLPVNIHDYQHIIWDYNFLSKLNKIDKNVVCLGIHREALINTSIDDPNVTALRSWFKTMQFNDQIVLNLITSLQSLTRS